MEQEKFSFLITNITAVLHNYLNVAKYTGKVVLVIDARKGEVSKVDVSNIVTLDLEGYKHGKGVPAIQEQQGS